jgi:hypothetical protein
MLEFLRKNGLPVAQLATGVRKFVEAVEAATEGILAGEKYRRPLPEHLRTKDPAGNRDASSQCRCE